MSAGTSPHPTAGESPPPPDLADVPATGTPAAAAAPRVVTEPWWLRILLGVVALGAGVLVLAWPDVTLRVVAVMFGLNLLAEGIVRVAQSVMSPDEGVVARILFGLLGLVSIVLGVLCLRNVAATLTVLVLLVGLSWIVTGVVELIVALSSLPRGGWTTHTLLSLTIAAVAAIAGILVLAYPDVTLMTLVFLIAGTLMVYGTVSIASGLGLRMRREREDAS